MTILGDDLLQGELVYLNRLTTADVPLMAKFWSDMGFLRHLTRSMSYPRSAESLEEWIRSRDDEFSPPAFAIRVRESNQFIGACAFKDLRWQSRHSLFWIGIGEPAMRGRGFGSDATRVLLRYAFLELNLNCVALEVFSFNVPAIAAYRKVGFKEDGLMRSFLYRDGVHYDMHLMSMLRSEWEALYGQPYRE